MKYKKSQIGWVGIEIFVPVVLFLYLAYANQSGNNPFPFVPFLLVTGLVTHKSHKYELKKGARSK